MKTTYDRLTNIFIDLIKIDAISKQEKPVANYISHFLNQLGIESIEDNSGKIVKGNTGNIIAKIKNNMDEKCQFAFTAHMDTVKSTKGINPQINREKICTDKTTILGADNRAGIALILFTIEQLKHNQIHHIPFEVVFTIGEETGLYGSTNLDINLLDSRVAYILDSSASPGYYVYMAPGALDFKIKLIGKSSHAAVDPNGGINAMSMANELLTNFMVGKIDEFTTINFGTICGGEANNVVPPQLELTGEIRSFKKERITSHFIRLETLLQIIAAKFNGEYQLTGDHAFPGFVLDKELEPIQYLNSAYYKINIKPNPIPYYGGSDANILNNRGIVAIDLGIGAKNPHSPDEFILLEDMKKMADLCCELVKNNKE